MIKLSKGPDFGRPGKLCWIVDWVDHEGNFRMLPGATLEEAVSIMIDAAIARRPKPTSSQEAADGTD